MGFHPDATKKYLQDVACITVSGSERFTTPSFWFWSKLGEGTDFGTKASLENLSYYLRSSPEQNLASVDVLSVRELKGRLRKLVGSQSGYISAEELPEIGID